MSNRCNFLALFRRLTFFLQSYINSFGNVSRGYEKHENPTNSIFFPCWTKNNTVLQKKETVYKWVLLTETWPSLGLLVIVARTIPKLSIILPRNDDDENEKLWLLAASSNTSCKWKSIIAGGEKWSKQDHFRVLPRNDEQIAERMGKLYKNT